MIRSSTTYASQCLEKTTTLKRPVLRDGNGKELHTFQAATVLHFIRRTTSFKPSRNLYHPNSPLAPILAGTPRHYIWATTTTTFR